MWHHEGMWAVNTMSCLPVKEVRSLSQNSCWTALLEPSWYVGVHAWLLRKEWIPSIPKAMVLKSKALLRLKCQLGIEEFEEKKIGGASLAKNTGESWILRPE